MSVAIVCRNRCSSDTLACEIAGTGGWPHTFLTAHATARSDAARMYFERFVELYGPEDGWKANARATLEGLGSMSSRAWVPRACRAAPGA